VSTAIAIRNWSGVEIIVETSAYELRASLLAEAAVITYVSDPLTLDIAVRTMRDIAGFTRGLESARVDAKGPVLDLGRRLDGVAKETAAPLEAEAEAKRLNGLVTAYHAGIEKARRDAEERLRRAEAERLSEIHRIELERQRVEVEARRKAEAEAAAARNEQEKIAALQRWNDGRLQREREAMGNAETVMREAEAATRIAALAVPAAPKVDGLSVKRPWTFEVINIQRLSAARPELVNISPRTADINAAIRSGERDIPGLRVYEDVRVEVRS
jgi:hypothetical protein